MPQEYNEGALRSAYGKAANEMGAMDTQISMNGRVDVTDNSIVHHSSTSPLSFIFGLFSWAEIPYSKFSMQDPEWHSYLVVTAIPALCVLLIGGFVCLWLLAKLCCGPKPKAVTERPSSWHLKWTTCTGFLLLWVCVGICIGRGTYAYDLIYDSVADLQPDVEFICYKIEKLQPGFQNAQIWLEDWQTSCVGWSALEPMIGKTISEVNTNYTSYVSKIAKILYSLEKTVKPLPAMIQNFRTGLDWFTHTYKVWIGITVFLPTVLASLLCFFIVQATLFDSGNPRMARITNMLVLEYGAVPIVVVILIMTVISGLFMFAGTALGGFCWDPGYNTVNLVSAAREGTRGNNITTLVSFYVEGPPTHNTIIETLRKVDGIMTPISSYMWIITPALELLGLLCQRIGSADLGALISEAIPDVNQILPIAKRDRVYSHYDSIVNRGICGQLASAIGWYMICTMICGMVLLPIIAVEAHKYLTFVAAEESNKKVKQQETEALITRQDDEEKQKRQKQNFWTCCSRAGGGREVASTMK